MFENHGTAVLSMRAFLARLLRCAGVGLLIAAGVLGLGTLGYCIFNGMPWIEALENATMVFSREGLLTVPNTTSGKLFVFVYAFSSRVARPVIVVIILAPFIHRAYHKFNRGSDPQAREPQSRVR